MLNLREKELFDTKISIINNKSFRDSFIASQVSDIDEWDVGLVALWNTPVLYYELKKAYPNKKFYYVETEALKGVYGVDLEDAIYIKEEEELADIMKQFKNPKLIINPPYSIGGKVVAKCKEVCPDAKYSILMPIAQYKAKTFCTDKQEYPLYQFIDSMQVVGGTGFDASITANNCIITLKNIPNKTVSYEDISSLTFDRRYKVYYEYNIVNKNKYFKWQFKVVKNTNEAIFEYLHTLTQDCCLFFHRRLTKGLNKGTDNYAYKFNNNIISWDDIPAVVNGKHGYMWAGSLAIFPTKIARQNGYLWLQQSKVVDKLITGLHTDGSICYALPQIDWTNIHINQKALWDQGLYDEAVLAEMGLKWAGDTIVKETN